MNISVMDKFATLPKFATLARTKLRYCVLDQTVWVATELFWTMRKNLLIGKMEVVNKVRKIKMEEC